METTADPAMRQALLERAAALVPTLRKRSAHCEALRRIPDETIADYLELGIHRIAQPRRFGGMGLGIDTVTDVAIEIGRGCGSTAWMAGQWAGHNFMVGNFPEEAQKEYWSDSFDVLSSTASAIVRCDARDVPGGFHVSAQLKFSSGVDAAQWLLLLLPTRHCLVPRSDFEILDDWHVAGLRGTGSKSVLLKDVFVPAYRTVEVEALVNGRAYGAELYPDNPYYQVPFSPVLNTMLLAPTIGMARGLLELFDERVRVRVDGHTATPAYQRPGTQLRFAEASVEVDTAVLLLRRMLDDFVEWGSSGKPMPLSERARIRRDVAYAARQCIRAADRLLESGDASAMYDNQLVQRWARDIHMAGLQIALTWDEPAMSYSQVCWGLPPVSKMT